jgi:hypothetical protein
MRGPWIPTLTDTLSWRSIPIPTVTASGWRSAGGEDGKKASKIAA